MAEEHPNYNKTEARLNNHFAMMSKCPNNIENNNWMNMTQTNPYSDDPVTLLSSGIHSRNKTIPKFVNFNNTFSGIGADSLSQSAIGDI